MSSGSVDHARPRTPYVPRTLAEWLHDDPGARHRMLDGTTLFFDVSGFTVLTERLAALGPSGVEELTDLLNAMFAALLAPERTQGGDVLAFGGDAALVLFAGAGHAARAATAALAMQDAMAAFARVPTSAGRARLACSIGLATGPVHLHCAGGDHRALLAFGSTVDATLALERAARGGEVRATAAVRRAAGAGPGAGDGRLRGPVVVDDPSMLPRLSRPDAAAEPPATALPGAVRRFLAEVGQVEGEHRQGAVGFVRVQGFAGLRERGGDAAVSAALDTVLARTEAACEAHGVTFLAADAESDGLKIMLVAGAPTSAADDADRLLHVLRAAVKGGAGLDVRGGAHGGRVLMLDLGAPHRRVLTTIGDPVNIAARVTARARAGTVLATDALLARTRTAFRTTAVAPFAAKGKAEPLRTAEVGEPRGRRRRADVGGLAGRDDEVATLTAPLAMLAPGGGAAAELLGEPGIGKSRLLAELRRRAEAHPQIEVEGTLYGARTPYLALRGPLRRCFGASVDALRAWVEAHDPGLEPWLPLLAIPLGLAVDDTAETRALAPELRRARLESVVVSALRRVLPVGAVVLVDEAQWVDEAGAGLLSAVALEGRHAGWYVVGARRPGEGGFTLPDGARAVPVPVAGLSDGAAAAIATAWLRDHGTEPTAARVAGVVARGQGNPLFVQELAVAVAAGGDLHALPDTVEALITARLDTLAPRDRALVRTAAVLGVHVDVVLLGEVIGRDAADDLTRLGDFLERDAGAGGTPDGYRFRHALLRDVAYRALHGRVRRGLHGAIGDALLRRHAADPHPVAALLSLHFAAADRFAEAWTWSRAAAAAAAASAAPADAVVALDRALAAARRLPGLPAADVAAVHEQRHDALYLLGRFDEATAALRRARRLARDAPLHLAALARKAGLLQEAHGRLSEGRRWLTRGLRTLEGVAPGPAAELLAAQLHRDTGALLLRQGRHREALGRLQLAVALAEASGDRTTSAHALYLLDWAREVSGLPYGRDIRRALALYEDLGDWRGQGTVLNNMGASAFFEGRWDDAAELYERGMVARELSGEVTLVPVSASNLAELLLLQGHVLRATTLLEDTVDRLESIGYTPGQAFARGLLGLAYVRAGRLDEGAHHLRWAVAACDEAGLPELSAQHRLGEAELALAAGRADDSWHSAIDIAAAADDPGFAALAYALAARAAAIDQRPEVAARALADGQAAATTADAPHPRAMVLLATAEVTADHEAAVEARAVLAGLGVVV